MERVEFKEEGYFKTIECQRDSFNSGYFTFFNSADSLLSLSIAVTNEKQKTWGLKEDFYQLKTVHNPGVFYAGTKGLFINQEYIDKKKVQSIRLVAKFFNAHVPFYNRISFGDARFDQFTYDLNIGDFNLQFHPVLSQLDFCKVDTLSSSIKVTFSDVDNDTLSFLPIAVYKGESAKNYLSNWYQSIIPDDGNLEVIVKDFESLYAHSSQDEILKNVFKYARQKIRYLSIEDGLQGIIPRSALSTCQNKYGDCKDKGVLIHALLEYYKLESYIAISSTRSHPYDMDFPSVSCANHVVAISIFNGDTLVLDGTDTYGQLGVASFQTLGRKLFIVKKDDPFYYRVSEGVEESDINLQVDLDSLSGKVRGSFRMEINGHYSVFLRSISSKDSLEISHLKKWLSLVWPEVEVNSLSIKHTGDNYQIRADFESDYEIISFKNKKILDTSFLPKINPIERDESNMFPFTYSIQLSMNSDVPMTTVNEDVSRGDQNQFIYTKRFTRMLEPQDDEKFTTLTFTSK